MVSRLGFKKELKMTVAELIKELEAIRTKYGDDMKVVVQYRDEGGDYYGVDEDVYRGVDEDDREVVL